MYVCNLNDERTSGAHRERKRVRLHRSVRRSCQDTSEVLQHPARVGPRIYRLRLQNTHKNDSDLSFEFFEVAFEVEQEIEQVRSLQATVYQGPKMPPIPQNDTNFTREQEASYSNAAENHEPLYRPPKSRSIPSYGGSLELERIPEAPSIAESTASKQYPFNERPFEFHWRTDRENVPPQPVKVTRANHSSTNSSPNSAQRQGSRARAMGYKGHLELNHEIKWMGQQSMKAVPKSISAPKDPLRWEPPSPKKETRKVKPNPPGNLTSQQKRPIGDSSKEPNKRKDYEKPWRVEKPSNKPRTEHSEFLFSIYPDGEGPDSGLIKMLEREVIDRNPNVSFDDIAALDEAKKIIEESVLLPLMMPTFFVGIRKPRKGVLLFGPPGTGKTMLAKAVASKGKTTFFNVHSSSLASKWKGDSEKLVRVVHWLTQLLFEMARFYAPTTIFIDEIDCIAGNRSEGEHESSRKVKSELLVQIDGAAAASEYKEGEKVKNVILLGATNLPWDLDAAIIRRLDKRIYIPLPDEKARSKLFEILLKGVRTDEDIDWNYLVQRTEYYSGDDLNNVCRDASMMPLRRELSRLKHIEGGLENVEAIQERLKDVPISMQDFLDALEFVKPTNGKDKLERYRKWMEECGSA